MGFLLSDNFVKIEIIFLLASISYIIFHFGYEVCCFFLRLKSIFKPKITILDDEEIKAAIGERLDKIDSKELKDNDTVIEQNITEQQVEESEVVRAESDNEEGKEEDKQIELSRAKKDNLNDIIKISQTKINRGEYSDAKAKIIEGLSIDKFNKQLNLLLASLYEKDKDYKKAEFVYKDLIVINDHDTEIYLKLGFILSIQSKYEVAFEIYKKLHSLDKTNFEAIEMLANIAHHLGNYEDSKLYSKNFLKKNPRNIDILYLQSINLINLEERKDALETLTKVKQLEPYNVKVNELIEKLKLEIELENNFTNNSLK